MPATRASTASGQPEAERERHAHEREERDAQERRDEPRLEQVRGRARQLRPHEAREEAAGEDERDGAAPALGRDGLGGGEAVELGERRRDAHQEAAGREQPEALGDDGPRPDQAARHREAGPDDESEPASHDGA